MLVKHRVSGKNSGALLLTTFELTLGESNERFTIKAGGERRPR